jgi:predicted DNA-binding transcriptional regulator AlpA
LTRLLRFADLKARGIVRNWPTLQRWILEQGFPAGIKLGPNTRAWSESEINEWLAGRPNGNKNGGA